MGIYYIIWALIQYYMVNLHSSPSRSVLENYFGDSCVPLTHSHFMDIVCT